MNRHLTIFISYLLASVFIVQAQEDIVLKINGQPVYKNEFVKQYKESSSISAKEFVPKFVSRKIIAMNLKEKGIDTLTSFKILFANYKGQKIRSELVSNYRRDVYQKLSEGRLLDNSWIKCRIFEIYIPQKCNSSYIERCRKTADSIYSVISSSSDINLPHEVLSYCKYDGKPQWIRRSLLPQEVIASISEAEVGDVIHPVLVPSGFLIVKYLDKCDGTPVEVEERKRNSYIEKCGNILSVLNQSDDELKDELLFKLAVDKDSADVNVTDSDIRNYFKRNISQYYYDEPRFKGAVIHCASKKSAKIIKKYIKRYEYSKWTDALDRLTDNDKNRNVVMERGIFKKKDNHFVDKYVFKVDNDAVYSSSMPYSFVIGKKMKKKPDSYEDVYDNVKVDVINYKMMTRNQDLLRKYKVEIDENVLKTVNNSGSN